jgi:chromosome segregation ATPase
MSKDQFSRKEVRRPTGSENDRTGRNFIEENPRQKMPDFANARSHTPNHDAGMEPKLSGDQLHQQASIPIEVMSELIRELTTLNGELESKVNSQNGQAKVIEDLQKQLNSAKKEAETKATEIKDMKKQIEDLQRDKRSQEAATKNLQNTIDAQNANSLKLWEDAKRFTKDIELAKTKVREHRQLLNKLS